MSPLPLLPYLHTAMVRSVATSPARLPRHLVLQAKATQPPNAAQETPASLPAIPAPAIGPSPLFQLPDLPLRTQLEAYGNYHGIPFAGKGVVWQSLPGALQVEVRTWFFKHILVKVSLSGSEGKVRWSVEQPANRNPFSSKRITRTGLLEIRSPSVPNHSRFWAKEYYDQEAKRMVSAQEVEVRFNPAARELHVTYDGCALTLKLPPPVTAAPAQNR